MTQGSGSNDSSREVRTDSGIPVDAVYRPTAETAETAELRPEIGEPGQYPYTRGVHPTMYRGRLWTMRQYAGFGTAHETNRRYHYLLERGQTGLSVAFDLPTTPIIRWRRVRWGGSAWPCRRSTTCGCCSTASSSIRSRPR